MDAYNRFDIENMVTFFHDDIVFENISNGIVTISLSGLSAVKEQADLAKQIFSKRKQTITAVMHRSYETEVDIDNHAILAKDLPHGLKKGEVLNLKGKSIFKFSGDEIISLTDIS